MNHVGNFLKRTLCATLACTVFLGCFVSPSRANDTVRAEDVYDLILEVTRNRKTLSTAIIGLEKDGQYFLPMSELASVLNFNARANLQSGTIEGFFLSQENTYRLNVKDRTYSLKGKTHSFSEGEAFTLEQQFGFGDIYVSPELINAIWPIEAELNPLKLELSIETEEKLPSELRKARAFKRTKNLNAQEQKAALEDGQFDGLQRLKNKPRKFSLPALDISSSVQWLQDQGTHRETLGIAGRNDLAYGEVNYNLRLKNDEDDRGVEDARIQYTKRAYDNDDLPYGLKLFQAGDISVRPARLIDGSIRGRGAVVTNAPNKRSVDFDSLVVEGFAEPGWEVELYRNNQLIGFQIVSDTGEYRFENVEITYSLTTIKTILYGPQGEVEERVKEYNISQSQLRPGELIYEVGVLDADRDLIPTEDNEAEKPGGFTQNASVRYGINRFLTGRASLTTVPTQTKNQRYATAGLDFSFLGTIGTAEVYRSLEGGTAFDFSLAGKYLGTNLRLRTAVLSDFESEDVGFDDRAEIFKFDASASRSFELPFGSMGLSFKFDHDKFEDNTSLTRVDSTQSLSLDKLRLTHSTDSFFNDTGHQRTDGRFNVFYRLHTDWRLRALANYDIYPNYELRNMLAELRYKDRKGLTGAFEVERNISNDRTEFGAQLGYDFGTFRSSIDTDWDADSGLRALWRTSFSMAPYGPGNKYNYSSKSLSNRSAVNGRLYIDKDYNGIFNDGDKLLDNAKIDIGKKESDISLADGVASFNGGADYEYTPITVDQDTLEDPYLIPYAPGYESVLRLGTVQNLDFPLIETGAIDGFVYGPEGPIGNVRLELLDSSGNVLDTTSSAFDGFYTFEYLTPGPYTVRLDPAITHVFAQPRSVSVTSDRLFQDGADIHLLERAAEAVCSEEAELTGRVTQNCQANAPSLSSGIEKSALGPTGGTGPNSAVTHVRFGKHSGILRISLDLSGPAGFRVWEQSDRKEVTIDMPELAWNAGETLWVNPKPKILKDYRVERLENGGTRLILSAANKMTVKQKAALPPNKDTGAGYRLFIDVAACSGNCQ